MRLSNLLVVTLPTAISCAFQDASSRNLTAHAAATTSFYLDMYPSIVDPQCGSLYSSTISVQYADDDFFLSPSCQAFLNLIGGRKGKKDADVLFLCASGQTMQGTGADEDKMKVFFFTTSKGPDVAEGVTAGTNNVAATMEVTYTPQNLVLQAITTLSGVWDKGKQAMLFGSFTCE